MHTRTVTRFVCDFCQKSLSRKGAMKDHEEICARNPARSVCRVCERHIDSGPSDLQRVGLKPSGLLVTAYAEGGLDSLRRAADNCPACMLAGILQARKATGGDEGFRWDSDFDYAKELENFRTEEAKKNLHSSTLAGESAIELF